MLLRLGEHVDHQAGDGVGQLRWHRGASQGVNEILAFDLLAKDPAWQTLGIVSRTSAIKLALLRGVEALERQFK